MTRNTMEQGTMAIKAFIFDMDGTIAHTLPDLAICANEALSRMGYPTCTYEEVESHIGAGGKRLINCVVPDETPPDLRNQTFELWRSLYRASDYAHTEPFPGVVDTLKRLRERNVKTAVLSNKFDVGVRFLADRDFPGLFDKVQGEIATVPRKPDPTSLLSMIEDLGVRRSEAAYVGDTQVDVQTARNADVKIIGVSWGYDKVAPLPQQELDAYIHDPAELLTFV